MIRQRINAGLARAREALASRKQGMLKIAAAFGVGSGTVQRIKAVMTSA
jgi:hypothetical protein